MGDEYGESSLSSLEETVRKGNFPPVGHTFLSTKEASSYITVIEKLRATSIPSKRSGCKMTYICENCGGSLKILRKDESPTLRHVVDSKDCTCEAKKSPLSLPEFFPSKNAALQAHLRNLVYEKKFAIIKFQEGQPDNWAGPDIEAKFPRGPWKKKFFFKTTDGKWIALVFQKKGKDGNDQWFLANKNYGFAIEAFGKAVREDDDPNECKLSACTTNSGPPIFTMHCRCVGVKFCDSCFYNIIYKRPNMLHIDNVYELVSADHRIRCMGESYPTCLYCCNEVRYYSLTGHPDAKLQIPIPVGWLVLRPFFSVAEINEYERYFRDTVKPIYQQMKLLKDGIKKAKATKTELEMEIDACRIASQSTRSRQFRITNYEKAKAAIVKLNGEIAEMGNHLDNIKFPDWATDFTGQKPLPPLAGTNKRPRVDHIGTAGNARVDHSGTAENAIELLSD